MGMGERERTCRVCGGFVLTALLVFFWTIPVAFVASLTSLESLSTYLPFLVPLIDASPALKSFLEGFLPGLALLIFNMILPMILVKFTAMQGVVSHSKVQEGLLRKFFIFQILNNFIVVVLAGALFDIVEDVIKDPTSLPKLLGQAIPGRASFYINYILIASLTVFSIKILNPAGLIIGTLMRKYLAKTELQKQEAAMPLYVEYGRYIPLHLFVFLITYIYAPISPTIIPFGFLYFVLGYAVTRYQLMYHVVPTYESGGAFWPIVFNQMCVIMLVAQITLIGVFSLKLNAFVAALTVPLPFLTYFFNKRLNKLRKASHYLSLEECVQEVDEKAPRTPLQEEAAPLPSSEETPLSLDSPTSSEREFKLSSGDDDVASPSQDNTDSYRAWVESLITQQGYLDESENPAIQYVKEGGEKVAV